jgi:hypothetical protein
VSAARVGSANGGVKEVEGVSAAPKGSVNGGVKQACNKHKTYYRERKKSN